MCEMLPRPCTQRSHLARLPAHSSFNKRVFLAQPSANATHAKRIAWTNLMLRFCVKPMCPKPNTSVDALSLYRKRSTKFVLPESNLKQFKREQFGVSSLHVCCWRSHDSSQRVRRSVVSVDLMGVPKPTSETHAHTR